jgi:hypothetical protein
MKTDNGFGDQFPPAPGAGRPQAQGEGPAKRSFPLARLVGLLFLAIGIAAWWYNRHLAATEGQFYIKLCILGPLGVFGGLLMLVRPEWAGPWRPDSTPAHKISLIAVIGLMVVGSGFEMYSLKRSGPPRGPAITPWNPSMGRPPQTVAGMRLPSKYVANPGMPTKAAAPEMNFQGRTYRLASFNQKHNPMWEFTLPEEKIDDWKTLLTVVDRPDASTRKDLDRLAEGLMSTFQNRGAKILLAKTMQQPSGGAFNYMVAAFDEPGRQRFELNFVKMALGPANATVLIYGVRIADPQDYRTRAKEFLDRNSGPIGMALANAAVPDTKTLPRKEF